MQSQEHRLSAFPLQLVLRWSTGFAARGWTALVAVLLWGVTALAAVLIPVLGHPFANALNALVLITFATTGAVIVLYRPTNAIGWIFALGTLLWALGASGVEYAATELARHPHSLAGTAEAAVFGTWARACGWTLMVTFLLLLFPSGRLPSLRWRPVAFCAVAYLGLWTVAALLAPTPVDDRFSSLRNPFGVQAASGLPTVATALSLPVLLVCAAALFRRFAKARGEERQQLKWLAYGTALPIVLIGLVLATDNGNLPWQQTVVIMPVTVGMAILRHHLWDIELVINRTLVYGALTACVVGLYILIVGVFGALLQTQRNPVLSLLAAALVAILFQPLRDRLQHGMNRLMYGERDEPYAVVARLGQRLETALAPEVVLPTIVETVTEALRLPYAAIALQQSDGLAIVAASGPATNGSLHLPLVYQNEAVGELVLAPRSAGESFTPADERLLRDLARHAGIAAHAVQLTAELRQVNIDLQRSRARLVTAREEERRRLRRDLHDGLGAALTGLTFGLDTASNLLFRDPEAVRGLLQDLKTQAQAAIGDIRHLVYDLRPPILDELGLTGALREQVSHYQLDGTRVALDVPDVLPPLPAAVEVAAYRIVLEALANVVRHAQTHRCAIHLAVSGDVLTVEVRDDGVGLAPDYHAGIGMTATRERAAELGGSVTVESIPTGGTCVLALLPLVME